MERFIGEKVRNIFIIVLMIASMGYMFYILADKYNSITEEQDKKVLQQKQ